MKDGVLTKIGAFRSARPKVRVTLHEMSSMDQLIALQAREVDAAIIRNPPRRYAADNFQVYESGVKQDITYFTRSNLPVALALLVGIISGTYSSIFNASQIVSLWQELEDRLRHRATASTA